MGFFSWLLGDDSNSDVSSISSVDTPSVNCDGTPMVSGSYIDVEGKVYGQCDTDTSCGDSFDLTNTGVGDSCFSNDDTFSSNMEDDFSNSSSFNDDSFSSSSDDW